MADTTTQYAAAAGAAAGVAAGISAVNISAIVNSVITGDMEDTTRSLIDDVADLNDTVSSQKRCFEVHFHIHDISERITGNAGPPPTVDYVDPTNSGDTAEFRYTAGKYDDPTIGPATNVFDDPFADFKAQSAGTIKGFR